MLVTFNSTIFFQNINDFLEIFESQIDNELTTFISNKYRIINDIQKLIEENREKLSVLYVADDFTIDSKEDLYQFIEMILNFKVKSASQYLKEYMEESDFLLKNNYIFVDKKDDLINIIKEKINNLNEDEELIVKTIENKNLQLSFTEQRVKLSNDENKNMFILNRYKYKNEKDLISFFYYNSPILVEKTKKDNL